MPSSGGSKWTSSPRASCANQVIPSVASAPSIRAQSCSRWYLSSAGYDSVAATGARLPVVDRLPDDACSAVAPADVDRELGAGLGEPSGDVPHPDPAVEHRRVRARRDLAASGDRHTLARDRPLFHHERHELPLGAGLLDPAQLVDACELLLERTDPT